MEMVYLFHCSLTLVSHIKNVEGSHPNTRFSDHIRKPELKHA